MLQGTICSSGVGRTPVASSRGVWLSITPTTYQVAKYKWQGERADLMCNNLLGLSKHIEQTVFSENLKKLKTTLKTIYNRLSGDGTGCEESGPERLSIQLAGTKGLKNGVANRSKLKWFDKACKVLRRSLEPKL